MNILADYVEHGYALVPIPIGEKGPKGKGWNNAENVITDPKKATLIYGNVGIAHLYCSPYVTAALDIDDLTLARTYLSMHGIDLDDLLDAQDARLMDGPLGLAQHRCMATLVFACGADLSRERRDLALQLARECTDDASSELVAGVTSPHPRIVVLRTLSPLVEPAQTLLRSVWAAWRKGLWDMGDKPPRIWAM